MRDITLENKSMDAVLAAADVGCWASYTQAKGGALVARRDLVVRLMYEITECGNEYGEAVQRIQGVYSPLNRRPGNPMPPCCDGHKSRRRAGC